MFIIYCITEMANCANLYPLFYRKASVCYPSLEHFCALFPRTTTKISNEVPFIGNPAGVAKCYLLPYRLLFASWGLFKRIQHCWTNIIQRCYYNRYDCFSFKSFWLDKLYSNSKPSLDKNIWKRSRLGHYFNNVGWSV